MSNQERTAQEYAELMQRQTTIADIIKDVVNHPPHYTAHPSGVECIQITEHMNFCLGNAVKYIWRADLKNDAIEDLKKAVWYVNREIERREKALQTVTIAKVGSRKG
jgi:hypothetical protein